MLVKTKIKEYPDGSKIAYVYEKEYIKGTDAKKENTGSKGEYEPDSPEYIKYRNYQKSKTKIRDYVLCNEFKWFITLTFKDERADDEACFKKLSNWLKHMRRKHGKFNYVILPERHKTGEIHFHGVIGDYIGGMTYSGVKHKGVPVFNIDDWEKNGHSTATEIESKNKTATYITKYVIKDMDQDLVGKGKKKYWSSRGLTLPAETYYSDIPFSAKNEVWSNDSVKIYNL